MSDSNPSLAKASPEELAQRFGIALPSENVKRLGELVGRRDSWGDDIAKIVESDKQMTSKLVKIANPNAKKEAEYRFTTTQDCMGRVGMANVLLLAMTEPLSQAVMRTFATMLSLELEPAKVDLIKSYEGEHIIGEVTFTGKATGVVQLRLLPATALLLAARMLGMTAEELAAMDEEVDVVGELCNMIAGNFKSNLCDARLECKLTPPKISSTVDFKLIKPQGSVAERFMFRSGEIDIVVDLSVNPRGSQK